MELTHDNCKLVDYLGYGISLRELEGFNYIAQDRDGRIFAFKNLPIKLCYVWISKGISENYSRYTDSRLIFDTKMRNPNWQNSLRKVEDLYVL